MVAVLSPAIGLIALRRLVRRGPAMSVLALVVLFGLGLSAGPAICTQPVDCCTQSARMLDCIANTATACFVTVTGIEAAGPTCPALALSRLHLAGTEALGAGLGVQPELPPPRA